MSLVLGLDFDHTLVSYDRALAGMAAERGLAGRTKTEIRDALRAGPGGDLDWQRVQARLYGLEMGRAEWMEGAEAFLRACAADGILVHVVSHKTPFAPSDPTRFDLRKAALDWLADHGAFTALGLAPDRVHFAATRAEKLERIRTLGCTAFVDDLVEVLAEPGFPEGVARLLFQREGPPPPPPVTLCTSWKDVERHVLRGRA